MHLRGFVTVVTSRILTGIFCAVAGHVMSCAGNHWRPIQFSLLILRQYQYSLSSIYRNLPQGTKSIAKLIWWMVLKWILNVPSKYSTYLNLSKQPFEANEPITRQSLPGPHGKMNACLQVAIILAFCYCLLSTGGSVLQF